MNTLAWVFIFGALLVIRQVFKGRVLNLGEDLSDTFLALIQGDTDGLTEILARTGDSTTVAVAPAATTGMGSPSNKVIPGGNASLANAALARGKAAKGYRWAATGPDYYDCSGLIWRAAQDVGYKGSRFTTATIRGRAGFTEVSSPAMQGPGITNAAVGDIVVWRTASRGHMGVITGPDRFYSARSVKNGIGEASISGWNGSGAGTPFYLRFTG